MNELYDSKKISNCFWAVKGIAITSVVCAHCMRVTSLDPIAQYQSHILENFGSIGVGIFLFVSGYYFKPLAFPAKEHLKRKIKSIYAPWIIAGTCVWLYIVVRNRDITIYSWINYLLGNGSIYYFVSDITIYYILFYAIQKFKINLKAIAIVSVILNLICIIMEGKGYSIFPTPYLNPGLFIAYFALGQLVANREFPFLRYRSARALLCISIIILISPVQIGYYKGWYELPFECFVIYVLVSFFYNKMNRKLIKLGKNSYFIYLWHLPLAGIISNVYNRFSVTMVISVTRPVLVLLIMKFISYLLERCFRNNSLVLCLLGKNRQ